MFIYSEKLNMKMNENYDIYRLLLIFLPVIHEWNAIVTYVFLDFVMSQISLLNNFHFRKSVIFFWTSHS